MATRLAASATLKGEIVERCVVIVEGTRRRLRYAVFSKRASGTEFLNAECRRRRPCAARPAGGSLSLPTTISLFDANPCPWRYSRLLRGAGPRARDGSSGTDR